MQRHSQVGKLRNALAQGAKGLQAVLWRLAKGMAIDISFFKDSRAVMCCRTDQGVLMLVVKLNVFDLRI